MKIKVTKNGPYIVSGSVPLDKQLIKNGPDGFPCSYEKVEDYPLQENYHLCRCGQTKTPPFCDGSHTSCLFDGTETAKNIKYDDQAQKFEGPKLDLCDAIEFCASAKFCDRGKGTWQAAVDSDNPEDKKLAIETAGDCPSGRLVAYDKSGQAIEPDFPPSISIIEDGNEKLSGPIWVKGGIEIESADGQTYEKRNRVTLCRCGKSTNKPFCNGNHISFEYHDGDK